MGFFSTLQNWFWPAVPGSDPGSNPNAARVANPFAAPSDPAASRDPYTPDPYFDTNYTPTLSPVPTNPLFDQIRADAWVMPYTGVFDLENFGRETSEMRMAYRHLHRREPSIRSAIEGKNAAVASLDVTVIPEDEDNPADCRAAEFVEWTVSRTMHGWDGAISRVFRSALIDGFSVSEKVLKSHTERKWRHLWGLRHLKNRDTQNMELRLDAYRNVLGIVNTVRGLRTHDPAKVILFTHADLYDDPFGQSDIRAAYRSANLIEEAYKLWYLAIQIYGAPFLVGKYDDPVRRDMLFQALKKARAGGVLVCDKNDEVEVLNMASATSFDAFEKKVNKHREEIYLAVRGAYLPFLEGQGNDAHGNTAVHKVASDAVEYLCAKALGRAFSLQLVPDLVIPNFGENVGMPQVILGGVNWAETKQQLEVANMVMEKAAISKRHYYKIAQMPPPDNPEDSIGGPPPAPVGGLPGSPPAAGGPTGHFVGPNKKVGEPSAAGGEPPAKPDADKASAFTFAAGLAPQYANCVAPDRHGRYAGNLHCEFGLNAQQFAEATGLVRKSAGKGENAIWYWVPKVVAVSTASIGTDPARLQFRPFDGADGLTADRRADNEAIGTYDPAQGGALALWRDPATAKTIVVDGHKRFASAVASGVRAIRAWFVSAKTADQARSIGANLNANQFAKDAGGHGSEKGGGDGAGGASAGGTMIGESIRDQQERATVGGKLEGGAKLTPIEANIHFEGANPGSMTVEGVKMRLEKRGITGKEADALIAATKPSGEKRKAGTNKMVPTYRGSDVMRAMGKVSEAERPHGFAAGLADSLPPAGTPTPTLPVEPADQFTTDELKPQTFAAVGSEPRDDGKWTSGGSGAGKAAEPAKGAKPKAADPDVLFGSERPTADALAELVDDPDAAANVAKPEPVVPPPPKKRIKTVDRDEKGNISRITEHEE